MAFGIEFTNSSGNLFYGLGETVMLFYGKLSHNVNKPNDGNSRIDNIPIFNLPASMNVLVFSNTSSPINNYVHAINNDSGTWQVELGTYSNNSNGIHEFYVFVPVDALPVPDDYGLTIWDASSKVVFHSGRPPLQLKQVAASPAFGSGDTVNFPFKCASMPSIQSIGVFGGGGPVLVIQHLCQDQSLVVSGSQNGGYGSNGGYYRTTGIGIIDASFYDQFGSLGNWP